MNREILYRGKREDNGEYVTGSRIVNGKQYFIYPDEECLIFERRHGAECRFFVTLYEVIPETVGEYTGLTDKNGKKIFEGDIVKTKKYGKVIGHSNVNNYDVFKIVYEPAMFRLKNRNRGFNLVGDGTDLEVIGNIHDTPGLLEVSELTIK